MKWFQKALYTAGVFGIIISIVALIKINPAFRPIWLTWLLPGIIGGFLISKSKWDAQHWKWWYWDPNRIWWRIRPKPKTPNPWDYLDDD